MTVIPEVRRNSDWDRKVAREISRLSRRINTSNAAFGAVADLSASDATYLYFGFDTDWRIRRVLRSNGTADEATNSNNAIYADLTAAWPNRAALTYA